jgi:hypothetical protein
VGDHARPLRVLSMSSSVAQGPPGIIRGARSGFDTDPAPTAIAEADNWPRTKRPLPWLLAGFLVMIFLVPFDAIIFKVHMPANATFDRVFLVVMIAFFVVNRVVHGRSGTRRQLTPVEIAMLVFGGISLLSVVLNIDRIYQQNQLSFVEKQVSQLLAYGAFFFVVIATIRGDEVRAFKRLVIALACLTSVGVIYESRSGIDLFFTWAATVLGPLATVGHSPMDGGTSLVSGPTQHPLALASMLTIALPFAVMPLLESQRPAQRVKYLMAVGLILGADFSTGERTAIFAPIGAFIVLAAYNRQILRWTPVALILLIPVIHFASPGALGNVTTILPWSNSGDGGSNYTDGRSDDYAAVAPDVLNNLIIGRGYGTLDTTNWRTYRILDNNYLDTLFQVGIVGLISFLAIVFCAIMTSHGVIKRGGVRAPPALAAAAGCAAFGVVSATYDASGLPQAVYSFLFVAGLAAVVASKPTQAELASAAAVRVGSHGSERGSPLMRRALNGAGIG